MYSNFRKEMRIDSCFGFKSWDSDYVYNLSSIESNDEEEVSRTQ